eukprot:10059614-Alexandrium_andersonii.AAC.1
MGQPFNIQNNPKQPGGRRCLRRLENRPMNPMDLWLLLRPSRGIRARRYAREIPNAQRRC